MAEQKNESAGPVAAGTGAEMKAASFYTNGYPNFRLCATAFYWDLQSNSVQPIRDIAAPIWGAS